MGAEGGLAGVHPAPRLSMQNLWASGESSCIIPITSTGDFIAFQCLHLILLVYPDNPNYQTTSDEQLTPQTQCYPPTSPSSPPSSHSPAMLQQTSKSPSSLRTSTQCLPSASGPGTSTPPTSPPPSRPLCYPATAISTAPPRTTTRRRLGRALRKD